MIRERNLTPVSGYLPLGILLPVLLLCLWQLVVGIGAESPPRALLAIATALVSIFVLAGGLFIVEPNQSRVLQLFGKYVGTAKETGLRWANPFYSKRRVSVRIRNFETGQLKVNDADGNPVEIASVVVWKVTDSAEALFEVDDYEHYVRVLSEAALRNLAVEYPYDAHQPDQLSLRGATQDVAKRLKQEVSDRLSAAGVEVIETRISHLAYAPEIAGAMLQRQQASAVVAARQKIVEGAVGMVETALEMLEHQERVSLNADQRADMVANLLVVLCSDRGAQPVLPTGSRK